MIHAMIDIETLSTKVNAVVLQVGACKFDKTGLLHDLGHVSMVVDAQTQLDTKRCVDMSTIRFWMNQDPRVRDLVLGDLAAPVWTMGAALSQYLADADRIWAYGPHFDVSILDHLFDQIGMVSPWRYNAIRDARTLFDWTPARLKEEADPEMVHDALYDAQRQARRAAATMCYLERLTAGDREMGELPEV